MSCSAQQRRDRNTPTGRVAHSRKKLEQRMRKDIREGRDPCLGGVRHPKTCTCYDCLWGEVATQRLLAKRPMGYDSRKDSEFVPLASRTGRFSRSSVRYRYLAN